MTESGLTEDRNRRARAWFESLRDRICAAFESGGRSIVTEDSEWTAPRFTVMVLGHVPSVASQYVLVFPSTALAGTYVWV